MDVSDRIGMGRSLGQILAIEQQPCAVRSVQFHNQGKASLHYQVYAGMPCVSPETLIMMITHGGIKAGCGRQHRIIQGDTGPPCSFEPESPTSIESQGDVGEGSGNESRSLVNAGLPCVSSETLITS